VSSDGTGAGFRRLLERFARLGEDVFVGHV